MRNSIQGPLLRTGHNSSFKALGETGYPVFKMAFQLREAIHRLDAGHDLARHLAVPQNDQGGDRTDWYSSFPGDVIPWNKASESERASARQQFAEFQTAVQALSEQMSHARENDTGGDRQVFARLLKLVVHFPDYDFIYLVNGVLVITFWGFIHPTGKQQNPMHWLEPASVASAAPAPAAPPEVITPVAEPVPPVVPPETFVTKKRWRWLLWLLIPLLLLALLLVLLRRCSPDLPIPGLTKDETEQHELPQVTAPEVKTDLKPEIKPDVITQPEVAPVIPDQTITAPVTTNPQVDSLPTTDNTVPAVTDNNEVAQLRGDNTQPLTTDQTAPVTDDHKLPVTDDHKLVTNPVTQPAVVPPKGNPLILPPNLPDGQAQFLNGQWQVNGGIQDKLTGRPLQLQYDFKEGKGTVGVRQSNGVTCSGTASGAVNSGALNITNPDKMTCSDGSSFIVPTIKCHSPAAGSTDCVGNSGDDNTFPIRMLQPNNKTRDE